MLKSKLLPQKIAAALAAGTFLLSSPALAAENVFQFDQITVTADRITQTVAETPENVTVITNQQIQDKGAKTLADALTGVSGVSVSSYGNNGKAIAYILGSDRVVVMIDGKRMNLPQGIGTGAGGIDVASYLISPDNIDRIEVVKGGSSVLYGADAVGGVINIITKKGTGSTHVNTSIAAGNYGGRSYEITAGGQENKTHWQFSGQQESSDGQRSMNSDSKNKSFSLRMDQELSKNDSLTFTYDYYGNHAGIPGAVSALADYSSAIDYQDVLRHNWGIAYTKQHADGSRILRYYNNDQLYSGITYNGTWPFTYHNTVKAFEYQDSAKIAKNQLLTWGTEWRQDEVVSSDSYNVPHEGTTKALYLQNQINISVKDKVTLGLRHDDNDLYGKHWLPKAAYLHQANNNTSYFANWGKIFKAPKFDDLYGDYTNGYLNSNLKAETGWTADIGVKSKISDNTEGTLSIFKREITNAIKWLPENGDPSDYNTPWHPYNINQLTSTGIDASLISKLSPVTNMDIGYTYLDSHDQNNKGVGDPHNTFHIGFNIHQNRLSQSIYAIFKDSSGLIDSATDSDTRVSSNFIINTNTNYELDKNTTIFLKINNLLNKEYQAIKGYPADGRSFMLGIRHSL